MDINFALNILQIIVSITIVALVLIQRQDAGFYARSNTMQKTRRGTEKLVYNLTIIFGISFVLLSIIQFFV